MGNCKHLSGHSCAGVWARSADAGDATPMARPGDRDHGLHACRHRCPHVLPRWSRLFHYIPCLRSRFPVRSLSVHTRVDVGCAGGLRAKCRFDLAAEAVAGHLAVLIDLSVHGAVSNIQTSTFEDGAFKARLLTTSPSQASSGPLAL